MKISSIICTADILQTLSKITDSNLLQWWQRWDKRKCFHCQSEDHLIAKCPFKLNLNEKNDPSRRKDKEYQANGLIHSPTKCEHHYREIENPVENSMNEKTGNKTLTLTNGLIISDGKVDGTDVKVLRDTGCTTIFILEYVVAQENLSFKYKRAVPI